MYETLIKAAQNWSKRTAIENAQININFLSKYTVKLNQISLNVKPWIFSMAPKTAGESLNQYLTQVFTLKDILSVDSNELNNMPQVINLQNKCAEAITGHYSINDLLFQLIPHHNIVHLGMMRDPLERVVHLYNDIATHQMYANKNSTGLLDFETYVNELNPVEINNGQAKRFAGVLTSPNELTDKELYFKAKFNIDNCFSLVGITEQFDDFYQMLGRKCAVKFHHIPSIKRSKLKVRLTDIGPEKIELIQDKNKVDIQLYQYVKSKFNSSINY